MLCRTVLGNCTCAYHAFILFINSKLLISLNIITYDPTNFQLTDCMCAIPASSDKQVLHTLNLTHDTDLFFAHVWMAKSFTFYLQNFQNFIQKLKHFVQAALCPWQRSRPVTT